MAWTMTTAQRIPVTVEFHGANLPDGSDGPILPVLAGSIVWAASDPAATTVVMNPDGLTGFIVSAAASAAGVVDSFTVSANPDTTGVGTALITSTPEDGTVTAVPVPLASVVKVTLGAPEAKPAA